MRRLLPLLLALAVLATAVPALAARPEPTIVDVTTTGCLHVVEVAVPKGGKRVTSIVTPGGATDAEETRHLNGHIVSVLLTGSGEMEVSLHDPRGTAVYVLGVPVTCEATRPSAG